MIKNRKLNSNGQPRKGNAAGKKLLPSQLLELQADKKELELNELRKKMREEQKLKFKEHTKTKPNHWRSSTNKKQIYGYSDMVLDHYTKESDGTQSNPQSAQLKQRNISRQSDVSGKVITNGLSIKKKDIPSTNIEANFHKALVQQNDNFDEVDVFLSGIKMEKYKDAFIDNGIEDRETILELQEEHLEQMNLPLGHKLKIMKKIKELKKKDSPVVQQPVYQAPKVSSAVTTQSAAPTDNLLDGEYDEEANKREFQEALDAWRDVGKNTEPPNTEDPILRTESNQTSKNKIKKSVRFTEESPQEFLIFNKDEEEDKEDMEAKEIKNSNIPTTEIKEGMIAFKGLSLSKN
jgi:hypothetical protein